MFFVVVFPLISLSHHLGIAALKLDSQPKPFDMLANSDVAIFKPV